MSVVISNNFKKKYLQGRVKGRDTWTFTPVNEDFKSNLEHDEIKIEHYRNMDDIESVMGSKAYKMNAKYINYAWHKVLDDDDFSNKPMFITKAHTKRLKGQKGNWNAFRRSNYWPTFSANADNLETYLNSKADGFYVIRSKDELSWFADRVNQDYGNNEIIGVLGDAIEGVIDNTIGISESRPFEGVLDGNGYALKNITIQCNQTDNGLVGVLGRKGVVRNFKIKGEINKKHELICEKKINLKYLTSEARDINCGILVGRNYGKVENINANELGEIALTNFVPEVYSVTNKSDDFSDFTDVRPKWSDNEDNFFFLNSWCINSPGNICPYVGYFAEGIYAERALMKRTYETTVTNTDGTTSTVTSAASIPVLRLSVNNGDLYTPQSPHEWFPPMKNGWTGGVYGYNTINGVLTPYITQSDDNTFPFNSNCSVPIRTKTYDFASSKNGHKCGMEVMAMNFTVFFDNDGNCYNRLSFITEKYANTNNYCFYAGIDILKLNQQSAKCLICKEYDSKHDDQDDADTDVWQMMYGDVTVKGGDKIIFVSGETEWVVEGTPKYVNDAGQLVEYPLRKNVAGQNVINKGELISLLEKPGVIPLGTQSNGMEPGPYSRFLYETAGGCVAGYEDIIGWYILGDDFATEIATINYTDAQVAANPAILRQMLEVISKFSEIDKLYGIFKDTDSYKTSLAVKMEPYLDSIKTWFNTDESTDGSYWHLDPTADANLINLIRSVSFQGVRDVNTIWALKRELQTKLNTLVGGNSNIYNSVKLYFFKEGSRRPNDRNRESDHKFFWRTVSFPIGEYSVTPSDKGELFYSVCSDNCNGQAGSTYLFATYFTNAYKFCQGHVTPGYVASSMTNYNNSKNLIANDIQKFLNEYVWVCDYDDNYNWRELPLWRTGACQNNGDCSNVYEFFSTGSYMPALMAMPGTVSEETGTTGRGTFEATFVDLIAFRHISPRPCFATTATDSATENLLNQQTLGHTTLNHPDGVQNSTIPYYKALVRAPEYYEMDAHGFFTTDVNASLASKMQWNLTDYYHPETAIINYNNNIQMRSLSAIDSTKTADWDYMECYLGGDRFDEYGWPIYDLSTFRCGTQADYYGFGRFKFNISNTLLNKAIRMHDSERAAYYVSPIVGANYGEISDVELNASASNTTNFVGFIGGLAGKQERGIVQRCSVNFYDKFTYAGVDCKKYWTVKYKTTPFYPSMISDTVNSLNSLEYSDGNVTSGVIDTLFSDRWTDENQQYVVEDEKKSISDDINVYYLKPIFNVGGLFGKIVPSYIKAFVGTKLAGDEVLGCVIDDISVNYYHTGNAKYINYQQNGLFTTADVNQLYNGEDIHNNYGSIAGLIELETNNVGAKIRQVDKNLGITIKNSSIKGRGETFNGITTTFDSLLPFGRFHYIPNEMNTIPATNMSPRDKGNSWCGPQTFTTWTLDYPIITNQRYDDAMAHSVFNTSENFGGIVNQSTDSCVGTDVQIIPNANGGENYVTISQNDSISRLEKFVDGPALTRYMRDTLKYVIETKNNNCNVSATSRTHIGMMLDSEKFGYNNISINFTPAHEILYDTKYPGIVHVNPSFGSYVNFTRTGLPETINFAGPTKIFDASTTLTNDRCFAAAKILNGPAPWKDRLKNRKMFTDANKNIDKYFYYTYEDTTGTNVTPFNKDVLFTTASSGANSVIMGYTFKDNLTNSADGFNYRCNYLHLGESVSNMQIRENLTKTTTFTTHGVSADDKGFGGILVTDSTDDIIMYIDNDSNNTLNGNSWNFQTPSALRDDGWCGVLIEVK